MQRIDQIQEQPSSLMQTLQVLSKDTFIDCFGNPDYSQGELSEEGQKVLQSFNDIVKDPSPKQIYERKSQQNDNLETTKEGKRNQKKKANTVMINQRSDSQEEQSKQLLPPIKKQINEFQDPVASVSFVQSRIREVIRQDFPGRSFAQVYRGFQTRYPNEYYKPLYGLLQIHRNEIEEEYRIDDVGWRQRLREIGRRLPFKYWSKLMEMLQRRETFQGSIHGERIYLFFRNQGILALLNNKNQSMI